MLPGGQVLIKPLVVAFDLFSSNSQPVIGLSLPAFLVVIQGLAESLDYSLVDRNFLKLPESPGDSNMDLSQVAADLQAVEYKYAGSVAAGGQSIPLGTMLTVTEAGDH